MTGPRSAEGQRLARLKTQDPAAYERHLSMQRARNARHKLKIKGRTSTAHERQLQRARDKKWREQNPERAKALDRAKSLKHYNSNRETVTTKMRLRAAERYKILSPDERRDISLRSLYKITLADYNNMLASQNNKCATCGGNGGKRGLFVDHCHKRKTVRALLCHHCNAGIGHAMENIAVLEQWINYLLKHRQEGDVVDIPSDGTA